MTRYLGNFAACEPWTAVYMQCDDCDVSWVGCWDNFECPICRKGELPSATDHRIVLCENCQSEGRLYRGQYEDERDCGPCPVCEGTGWEIIKTEPVTLEDIDP